MALRLIEVIMPTASVSRLKTVMDEQQQMGVLGVWVSDMSNNQAIARILVETDHTETISDILSDHFGLHPEFRMMLFSVEATMPLPPKPAKKQEEQPEDSEDADQESSAAQRISREELYYDIAQGAQLSPIYLVTVVLSTLVAAVGLLHSDVAVIIGAMVIAPLLGPNVALSLGTTLGDLSLMGRSLKTLLAGVLTVLVISFLIGYFTTVDPQSPEIAGRTQVDVGHMVLALAAGSAGALAFTGGVPATVIGVMVAVALLPPLTAAGLLTGAGHGTLATNALMLFVTNVACINLAGVFTFLARKIRPRTWWESERAGQSLRLAVIIWAAVLAVLLIIIWLTRPIS